MAKGRKFLLAAGLDALQIAGPKPDSRWCVWPARLLPKEAFSQTDLGSSTASSNSPPRLNPEHDSVVNAS